jgi:hypothetical protein
LTATYDRLLKILKIDRGQGPVFKQSLSQLRLPSTLLLLPCQSQTQLTGFASRLIEIPLI